MINPRRFKTATGALAHPESTARVKFDSRDVYVGVPRERVVVVKSKPGESLAELSRRIYARFFPWLREDGDDEDV